MKNNKSEYWNKLHLFGDFPQSQLIVKGFTATSNNLIIVHPDGSEGYPCDSAGKESVCNAGDLGSNPGLERFPWGRWESHFLGRLIRSLGDPKERGVWNSQGGRKDKLFSPLHSLGLYNNHASFLRTVSGKNLLANPVILKCKLWE